MWVIFRDPNTLFNHIDKYVYQIVNDEDILAYQIVLHEKVGGQIHDINQSVFFLQPFISSHNDVEYFARKYLTATTR
jgi:hypothetical protein